MSQPDDNKDTGWKKVLRKGDSFVSGEGQKMDDRGAVQVTNPVTFRNSFAVFATELDPVLADDEKLSDVEKSMEDATSFREDSKCDETSLKGGLAVNESEAGERGPELGSFESSRKDEMNLVGRGECKDNQGEVALEMDGTSLVDGGADKIMKESGANVDDALNVGEDKAMNPPGANMVEAPLVDGGEDKTTNPPSANMNEPPLVDGGEDKTMNRFGGGASLADGREDKTVNDSNAKEHGPSVVVETVIEEELAGIFDELKESGGWNGDKDKDKTVNDSNAKKLGVAVDVETVIEEELAGISDELKESGGSNGDKNYCSSEQAAAKVLASLPSAEKEKQTTEQLGVEGKEEETPAKKVATAELGEENSIKAPGGSAGTSILDDVETPVTDAGNEVPTTSTLRMGHTLFDQGGDSNSTTQESLTSPVEDGEEKYPSSRGDDKAEEKGTTASTTTKERASISSPTEAVTEISGRVALLKIRLVKLSQKTPLADEDIVAVGKCLETLDSVNVCPQVMRRTNVAKTVKKVKARFEEHSQKCKSLLSKWKKLNSLENSQANLRQRDNTGLGEGLENVKDAAKVDENVAVVIDKSDVNPNSSNGINLETVDVEAEIVDDNAVPDAIAEIVIPTSDQQTEENGSSRPRRSAAAKRIDYSLVKRRKPRSLPLTKGADNLPPKTPKEQPRSTTESPPDNHGVAKLAPLQKEVADEQSDRSHEQDLQNESMLDQTAGLDASLKMPTSPKTTAPDHTTGSCDVDKATESSPGGVAPVQKEVAHQKSARSNATKSQDLQKESTLGQTAGLNDSLKTPTIPKKTAPDHTVGTCDVNVGTPSETNLPPLAKNPQEQPPSSNNPSPIDQHTPGMNRGGSRLTDAFPEKFFVTPGFKRVGTVPTTPFAEPAHLKQQPSPSPTAKSKRKRSSRRKVASLASTPIQMKDESTRLKGTEVVTKVKELQTMSTYASEKQRAECPPTDYFMVCIDALKAEPGKHKEGLRRREKELAAVLVPDIFDKEKLGESLIAIGKHIKKGKRKRPEHKLVVTNDPETFLKSIYGKVTLQHAKKKKLCDDEDDDSEEELRSGIKSKSRRAKKKKKNQDDDDTDEDDSYEEGIKSKSRRVKKKKQRDDDNDEDDDSDEESRSRNKSKSRKKKNLCDDEDDEYYNKEKRRRVKFDDDIESAWV